MWGFAMLAVALAAAALLLYRVALGYPAPPRRYRRLGRGEAAFLQAGARVLYPPGGAIPPSGRDAELPGYVDALLDASQTRIRLLMHALFFLVEHATLIRPAPGRRGHRRFSSLGAGQQTHVLSAWASSRRYTARVVFTSLRALLTLGYFAYPPVLRQLRLAPLAVDVPVCEADLWYPPIGKGPEAIRWTRDDLTPPSEGAPLDPEGPLHPRYAERP